MVMAKFVTSVFLVATFDATFADQNVKTWQMCTYINHFLKIECMSLQKKKAKNNSNVGKYGISLMNLESDFLDVILILTKCPKVT